MTYIGDVRNCVSKGMCSTLDHFRSLRGQPGSVGDWLNAVAEWLLKEVPGGRWGEAGASENVRRLMTIEKEFEGKRWSKTRGPAAKVVSF